jgi:hypothetical protein
MAAGAVYRTWNFDPEISRTLTRIFMQRHRHGAGSGGARLRAVRPGRTQRRLRAMPETAHAMPVAVTGYGQESDRVPA